MRNPGDAIREHWRKWLTILGCWTLVGLFFASQTYISYSYTSYKVTFGSALASSLAESYVWAALSPAVIWLARRYRLEKGHWWGRGLLHAGAALGFAVLALLIGRQVISWVTGLPGRPFSPAAIHPNVLTYGAIVGIAHALDYYSRYRERELKASQLETRLAQAQLQVLKMQLHPHFLFNTLHAISALLHRDVEAADRMIARLSELLRLTLESGGLQVVPLRQELEFLQRYLEIEQTRFGDRLAVQMDIDPQALDAEVPNLILQPLVENAIRHGVAKRSAPGCIRLRAEIRGERLLLQVQDNGPGLTEGVTAGPGNGVGLTNTAARLQHLYGQAHRFELSNMPDGGLAASLWIPWKVAVPQEPVGEDD